MWKWIQFQNPKSNVYSTQHFNMIDDNDEMIVEESVKRTEWKLIQFQVNFIT